MIALLMSETDNVAVVVQDVKKNDEVTIKEQKIPAREAIQKGHKIAVRPIQKGEMVFKYGKIIGRASADIEAGQWVHCHNVDDITEQLRTEYAKSYRAKGSL